MASPFNIADDDNTLDAQLALLDHIMDELRNWIEHSELVEPHQPTEYSRTYQHARTRTLCDVLAWLKYMKTGGPA